MKRLFLILLFFIPLLLKAAPTILGSYKISKNKIVVGDPIEHTIIIEQTNKDAYTIFPNLDENYYGYLRLIKKGVIDTLDNGESIIYKQTNSITGFEGGMYLLPKIILSDANGATDSNNFIEEARIIVDTVSININGDIKDIQADKYKKFDYKILIAILIIAALALLFWWLYKRKKQQLHKKISFYEQAMLWLQDAHKHIAVNNSKEAISTQIKALKYYISNRFNLPIVDKTTAQTLEILQHTQPFANDFTKFKIFFERADSLKFAKGSITQEVITSDILEVTQFINQWEQNFIKQEAIKKANATK